MKKMTHSGKLLSFFSLVWIGLLAAPSPGYPADEALTPSQALSRAFEQNPEIAASAARAQAEESLIRSKYWLANPKIGLMREEKLNNMELEMGPMTFWTLSQEVMFPLKYSAMGSAQASKAEAARHEHMNKRLEVRQRVLAAYFGLYTSQRVLDLLEAQRETLREVARVAEARRAVGAVPQQDEMKAHVEQTRLEGEILLQQQEMTEFESRLNALLNLDASHRVSLSSEKWSRPKLTQTLANVSSTAMAGSKQVAREHAMVQEAEQDRRASKLGYFPDFMLSYQKPFINAQPGAYAASIELSIPLWFFAKQTSEVSSASSRVIEAEKNLEAMRRNTESEARSVAAKVETLEKLLGIYETALIPQATSTLNASRSAYSTGKVGFQELLDSERMVYSNQITYYQTLAKFVDSLAELERITGTSLSNLPFGDSL